MTMSNAEVVACRSIDQLQNLRDQIDDRLLQLKDGHKTCVYTFSRGCFTKFASVDPRDVIDFMARWIATIQAKHPAEFQPSADRAHGYQDMEFTTEYVYASELGTYEEINRDGMKELHKREQEARDAV